MTQLFTQKNQPNGGVPRIYRLLRKDGSLFVLVEHYNDRKQIYATEDVLKNEFNPLKK